MTSATAPPLAAVSRRQDASERSERALRRHLVLLIGAGVIALFALMLTSLLLFRRVQSAAKWVEHTYGAESRIATLGLRLEQIETARRGYLIEPDAAFLRTYMISREEVGPAYQDLLRFTRDNPRQTKAILETRELIAKKIQQYDHVIALSKVGDRRGALNVFNAERGQHVTQHLRDRLADLDQEEERLLARRVGLQNDVSLALLVTSVGLAIVLVAITLGVWLLVSRYAAALDRSQGELRRLNAGLESAVEERTMRLTRANDEIQRFAYIVSHDLRSPLVNVMGFTSELEASLPALTAMIAAADAHDPHLVSPAARHAVADDLPEAIGFIRSSTRKMDRLINAILKLSREGRRRLTPESLDMAILLQSVRDSMRRSIDDRGAEVVIEAPLPDLFADRLVVEQIFSNLLENAVKYLRPNVPGRIIVRGRSDSRSRVYEVEDNGRGIATKDQERVFDLFRRAGAQDQPGEGIGLAHVRALVYRLGGTIELASEPDRGSRFQILLPSSHTQELSAE